MLPGARSVEPHDQLGQRVAREDSAHEVILAARLTSIYNPAKIRSTQRP